MSHVLWHADLCESVASFQTRIDQGCDLAQLISFVGHQFLEDFVGVVARIFHALKLNSVDCAKRSCDNPRRVMREFR